MNGLFSHKILNALFITQNNFFSKKKDKWIFEEHQNKGKIKREEFVFQNTIREI